MSLEKSGELQHSKHEDLEAAHAAEVPLAIEDAVEQDGEGVEDGKQVGAAEDVKPMSAGAEAEREAAKASTVV